MNTQRALNQRIRALGFGPFESVLGRASVADLVPAKKRKGIYVLGFRTGEAYVGLSKDVTIRFVQHRRVHDDIEWFTSKSVPTTRLADEECRCLESIERSGVKLRNVALASFAPPTADLDLVVSKRQQNRFLASGTARSETEAIARAFDLRRKHLKRFGALMAHPLGLDALFCLAAYVRFAIPCPAQTQIAFWSCTALPGRGDLIRVNLHWQEVFTIAAVDQSLSCSLHLARQPLSQQYGSSLSAIRKHLRPVEVTSHRYVPGGQDQMEIVAHDRESLENVLALHPVQRAIRELNLRLMRKGPSMWGRSHCPQLADVALRLATVRGT